jgi:hypothetical protein
MTKRSSISGGEEVIMNVDNGCLMDDSSESKEGKSDDCKTDGVLGAWARRTARKSRKHASTRSPLAQSREDPRLSSVTLSRERDDESNTG